MFDKTSLHSLVTNGVSSRIAPLLIDKDHTVKEAAAGALRYAKEMIGFCNDVRFRNLVTVGADELKDHVINNDITASLLACIKEVTFDKMAGY